MANFSLKEFCRTLSELIGAERQTSKFFADNPISLSAVRIIAVGKAAVPMLKGIDRQLSYATEFLAVVPEIKEVIFNNLTGKFIPGNHPIPGAASFLAGKEVFEFVSEQHPVQDLVILISGGTSALLTKSRGDLSESDKIECHKKLVYSGLSISEINSIRRKISAIKGGKLLIAALKSHRSVNLFAISDVNTGSFHDIGSGPFTPDPDSIEKAVSAASRVKNFPTTALSTIKKQSELLNTTFFEKMFPNFAKRYTNALIFSQTMAVNLVVKEMGKIGFETNKISVSELFEFFENPQQERLKEEVWQIACGEREIMIPEGAKVGKGGRASHSILTSAAMLYTAGLSFDLAIFATDGKDGNSCCAGGYISSEILSKDFIEEMEMAVNNFDSASLLRSRNLAFEDFRSENNVGDIFLFRHKGLRECPQPVQSP